MGIWQFMKINSRLQAAEEAIDRVMTILHEFLGNGAHSSMKDIQSEINGLTDDVNNLKNLLQVQESKVVVPVVLFVLIFFLKGQSKVNFCEICENNKSCKRFRRFPTKNFYQ